MSFDRLAPHYTWMEAVLAGPRLQRCRTTEGKVDHYDVSYNFRGSVRTVQMAAPPAGNTIIVNQRGEPRM